MNPLPGYTIHPTPETQEPERHSRNKIPDWVSPNTTQATDVETSQRARILD